MGQVRWQRQVTYTEAKKEYRRLFIWWGMIRVGSLGNAVGEAHQQDIRRQELLTVLTRRAFQLWEHKQ